MAILSRFTQLLTADIHAVMDRIEEPRAQLKQALRELEAAQSQGQLRLKQLSAQTQSLEDQQRKLRAQQVQAEQELELCLDADSDTLAKKVIRRQLQLQQQSTHLNSQQEHCQLLQVELQNQLNDCADQAQLLAQQIELLPETHQPANAGSGLSDNFISDDAVEIALLAKLAERNQHRTG